MYKKVSVVKKPYFKKGRERQIECKYMIATKAIHKLGDISREFEHLSTENLCQVCKENDEEYIGSWITGFGFFDVAFSKETTRELTEEEIEYFNKQYIQLSNFPPQKLNVG